MPCYDGSREDARIDRETARKVEAALCAVITAFGGRRVFNEIDFTECGVTMEWLDRWWEEHLRKDAARKKMDAASKEVARKQAILDSGDYAVLHQMIKKQQDIMSTVAALQAAVPAGCETLSPPNPTAAIFRKRASKMLAELGALRKKEADLVQRAQAHIEESYQAIDTLYQEIDGAQLVIDEIVF